MTYGEDRGLIGVYDTEMTRKLAEIGVDAAFAKAAELGANISVSVVDQAARMVMFVRGDRRGLYSLEMVHPRAVTAAILRRRTCELADRLGHDSMYYQALFSEPFLPIPGGTPIANGAGVIVGAVGVGGGSEEDDQLCADSAAAAITEALNPGRA